MSIVFQRILFPFPLSRKVKPKEPASDDSFSTETLAANIGEETVGAIEWSLDLIMVAHDKCRPARLNLWKRAFCHSIHERANDQWSYLERWALAPLHNNKRRFGGVDCCDTATRFEGEPKTELEP